MWELLAARDQFSVMFMLGTIVCLFSKRSTDLREQAEMQNLEFKIQN